jgi:hypothetical protein
LGHGPIGALVSAWPALALIGSFELLMLLVRNASRSKFAEAAGLSVPEVPDLDEMVRAMHQEGTSQRAIARQLSIDRRKVKRALSEVA